MSRFRSSLTWDCFIQKTACWNTFELTNDYSCQIRVNLNNLDFYMGSDRSGKTDQPVRGQAIYEFCYSIDSMTQRTWTLFRWQPQITSFQNVPVECMRERIRMENAWIKIDSAFFYQSNWSRLLRIGLILPRIHGFEYDRAPIEMRLGSRGGRCHIDWEKRMN